MICLQCNKEFIPHRWRMKYCGKKCRRKHGALRMEEWRKSDREANPDKWARKQRITSLRRNYDMTVEQYDAMVVQQQGLCPICREHLPLVEPENMKRPPVDHDHKTGEPRAVVHNKCNRAIGLFQDESRLCRLAAEYLESHGK